MLLNYEPNFDAMVLLERCFAVALIILGNFLADEILLLGFFGN